MISETTDEIKIDIEILKKSQCKEKYSSIISGP